MPTIEVNGVTIYYEEAGSGTPLVFSHEFAGSYESWEPQVRHFARRYRVITYNHRGYPPSTVPRDPAAYAEELLVDDLRALLDALNIERAHIAGLSMGGAVTLKFAIAHPDRCIGAVVAGAGSGADDHEEWIRTGLATAQRFEEAWDSTAAAYAGGPARVQLKQKDPRGWQAFADLFLSHSPAGSANTFRGVQLKRRTIYEVERELGAVQVPVLIMVGDEDEPCLRPALFMKQHLPNAGLVMFPRSGHANNLEEPALFNQFVMDFLTTVEQGRWVPLRQAQPA
ncbi:MAG: alpha/beta fold hydrolase [Dehalococcoidia bacterium]